MDERERLCMLPLPEVMSKRSRASAAARPTPKLTTWITASPWKLSGYALITIDRCTERKEQQAGSCF